MGYAQAQAQVAESHIRYGGYGGIAYHHIAAGSAPKAAILQATVHKDHYRA